VVTDANGCTSSDQTTITVYSEPSAIASNSGPVCADVTSITLNETGGDAVSWAWTTSGSASFTNNSAQSPNISGFANGEVFTVVVTDANGCTSSAQTTVTVFTLPSAAASNSGPVCYSQAVVSLSETGGDAATWSWSSDGTASFSSNTAQNPNISNFADGEVFTVVVTDANGCTSSAQTTLTVYPEPTATATNSGAICSGAGTISLNETGGDAISWSWSSNGSAFFTNNTIQSPSISNFVDGEIFTVVITDSNGCTSSDQTTITVFDLPAAVASNDGPVCYDETSIQLSETGGEATNWAWSTDGSAFFSSSIVQNPTISNFADGETFTVTVTDANGCTATAQTTITVYPEPTAVAVDNGPICPDETSSSVNETGGDAVSWSWSSNGSAFFSSTTAQNPTITNFVDNEVFTVVVTDANGCTSSAQVTIDVTPNPIAADGGPVCYDVSSIMLTESSNDGIAWSWSTDGSANFNNNTIQNPTITNFTDGETFTVTVTDANGCTGTSQTTITVYPEPTVVVANGGPVCYDATSVSLNETGGDAVTWSWSTNGSAFFSNNTAQNPNVSNFVDGEVFTVEVTDANGCTSSASTTLTVNSEPTATASNNGPVCGDVTSVSLSETGGDAVTWSWSSNGSSFFSNSSAQNPTVTGFADGEVFTVVVTDANGCTSSDQTTLTVNPTPNVVASNNGPNCYDASNFTVSETGGDAVSWSWTSNGSAFFSSSSAQSPSISNFVDGEVFTVVVTDANGCTASASTTISVFAEPTAIANNSGPLCYDDTSLSLSETGGDAVSWSWSTSGSSFFSSTSAQNPSIINFADGEVYTVTITDANGCTSTASTTLVINGEPSAIANNNGPVCGDITSIDLSETGGDATLWSWSSNGSAVFSSSTAQNPSITNFVDGEVFTVNITDANGCTSSAQTTITVYDLPTATATNSGPICVDQTSMTLNETGGDATSWSWSSDGSAVFSSSTAQNPSISNFANGEVFTVVVTDANGCTASDQTTITVNPLPVVTLILGTDEACEDETSVALTGGSPAGGTYSGMGVFGSIFNPSLVGPGVYTITYTFVDGNGCSASATDNIEVFEVPPAPVTIDINCDLGPGMAVVEVTSPLSPDYEYQLDGGTPQSSPVFTNVSQGQHTITVTNVVTGCFTVGTPFDVDCTCVDPTTLSLSAASGSTCVSTPRTVSGNTFGGSATEVTLSHNGAGSLVPTTTTTSPFSFTYTPAPADVGTMVTITVTTNNPLGLPCTPSTATYVLTINGLPTAVASNSGAVCYDDTNITLSESGGDAVNWSWSSDGAATFNNASAQNPIISGFVDGELFTVTVTDGNGCTSTAQTAVTVFSEPTATASNSGPVCYDVSTITLDETGGDASELVLEY
jgi:hypothetical protein